MTVRTEEAFDDRFYATDLAALSAEIEDKLVKPLLPKPEEAKEKAATNVLLVTEPRSRPPQVERPPASFFPPSLDPFSGVGSSDLNPFGRIGSGGMLADPFQPRGGGFPGPRFDPPGPGFPRGGRGGQGFGGRRNFGDDLPPPGFDDMFM
jgi:hypothetical protein